MIYYFSGTGNSRFVAEQLAELTGDKIQSIASLFPAVRKEKEETGKATPTAAKTDILGFVFPVYAWGMPRIVEQFINNLQIGNKHPAYIYMVCTCGDDIGRTDRLFAGHLKKQTGLQTDAMWSVQMPNTYTALPGFDTDSPETVREKITAAQKRIPRIATSINNRERGITDVVPGKMPSCKTYILRPLFNKFLTGDRHFRVSPSCTHCRKCLQACPVGNICFGENDTPKWNGRCADCLGCYHVCPVHAITFGPFTKHKGQYRMKPTPADI